MSTLKNVEVVVAIDFGTSLSGYAYSFKFEREKIYVNSKWRGGGGVTTWQVPTAVLFSEDQKFIAFGFEAEDKYCGYAQTNEEHSCYFFHRFKMMLNKQTVSRNSMLKAANGKSMTAIDVFSGAITYLKQQFLNDLNHRNSHNTITVNKIRWVLTVPAIWGDAAKQFMREAALQAGIPTENLCIALEPECAALYAMSLKDERFKSNPGNKYALLDCGGGTIDTTFHEIVTSGHVRELCKASGGPWGSNEVDKKFEKFLGTFLSNEVVLKLKSLYPADWVDILRDFESVKRSLGNEDTLLRITPELLEIFEEITGIQLKTAVTSTHMNFGITMRGKQKLQIPRTIIIDIITDVSNNTKVHLTNKIKMLKEVDTVVVVGGFSNSSLFIDIIKNAVQGTQVFVPQDPEIAVMKGAVIYGWNTAAITSRRSKKTYGYGTTVPFETGKHPERLKKAFESIVRCNHIFRKLVTVGEEIEVGKVVEKTHTPVSSRQTNMIIPIYSSDKETVEYTDENGVEEIGCVNIDMPDTTGGKGRKVKAEYFFGTTEIHIKALDVTSGNRVEITCDFLTH